MTRRLLILALWGALFTLRPAVARAGATWVPVGPTGGEVDVVAAAPSDPTVVYAGSVIGGVFRSEDSGTTWSAANGGLSDLRIQCLAVSPADTRTVFAGTSSRGFKTTDGGASWTPLGGGFPQAKISSIVIDPQSPSTVYAAGPSNLVKSTDGGATWTAIGGADVVAAQPRGLAIDPTHTANLFLGTLQGGIYRSTNGGASWAQSNSGLNNFGGVPITAVSTLAVDPTASSQVWAGTFSDGVYFSSDGGASWTVANDGIPLLGLITGLAVGPDGAAYLSQIGGFYIRPPGVPLWLSTVPGANFLNSLSIGAGAVPPLYLGFGRLPFETGGFIRWDGGASFFASFPPLLVVAAIAPDPADPGRALVATTAMVFEYKSGGSSGPWSPPGSVAATAATIALFFDPRTAGVVYLGGAGGVYRSTDGAASSTKESLGDSTTIARSFIAQPATAQGVYVGTSKGLFQSADGITWSSGSADLAARLVFALAPDASSASMLWAGTDDGVYRSTDAGAHWAKAGTGVGGNVHAVLSTAGRLIAGADAGLFTSVDGGATWVAAAGVPATVNALVQNPSDGALFAGSLAGVFESTDGGASWASESEGLTNPNVICFGLLGDGTFLAGTNGGSAFALVRTAARGPVSRATESPVPRVLGPRP